MKTQYYMIWIGDTYYSKFETKEGIPLLVSDEEEVKNAFRKHLYWWSEQQLDTYIDSLQINFYDLKITASIVGDHHTYYLIPLEVA